MARWASYGFRTSDNPCIGCADRTAECHASCVKYTEWSAIQREKNRQLVEKKSIIFDIERANYERTFKR